MAKKKIKKTVDPVKTHIEEQREIEDGAESGLS